MKNVMDTHFRKIISSPHKFFFFFFFVQNKLVLIPRLFFFGLQLWYDILWAIVYHFFTTHSLSHHSYGKVAVLVLDFLININIG